MARSNQGGLDTAQGLYQLADEIGEDSPLIGTFRVSDGLKALSVGLVDGTAECLHGRPMSGIYKTLQRLGTDIVNDGYRNCGITPIYVTTLIDGVETIKYEPATVVHKDLSTEIKMVPVTQKVNGFGLNRLSVYTTYHTDHNTETGVPDYAHSALFSGIFYSRGQDSYVKSKHCRAGDFAFHMEILRGQLVLWQAAKHLPDNSIGYTHNLLNIQKDYGTTRMVEIFTRDLLEAGVAELVTT